MALERPMKDIETPTIKEGVGVCTKHGCNLWEVQKTVLSFKVADKFKSGEQHEYKPRFCPQCNLEARNARLLEAGALVDKENVPDKTKESATEKLKRTRGIDINRDVIVEFSYADGLSVDGTEKFVKWLERELGKEKRVMVVNTNKFVELRSSRFMSNEKKEQYLKVRHKVETADVLVINTLADYGDDAEEDINNLMLSAKNDAVIVIITIPESRDRLDTLPSKLKYRFKHAQRMGMSSTARTW